MSNFEEDAPWEEPAEALEETIWNGARNITPGWDPKSDPDMQQVFGISLGAGKDSKRWEPKNKTGLQLLVNPTTPMEGKKDGAAFVGGHLVGTQRRSTAVKAIYVPGLDIDVGMPIEDAVEILRNSDKTGVLYTTHSHMKTRLDLAKNKVLKFADANGLDSDDLGDEAVQGVLKEQNYYPYIYENARYLSEEHTENGIVVEVETPPIPKFRVVFFLEEPFVIQEVDKDQQKAINIWKKQIIPNLATSLGLPYDHTGVDPARLFYLPRYAKGRPHESIIFGGKLLKWQDYLDQNDDLADAVSGMVGAGKTSKTKTPVGKALGEWWSKRATGFLAADLFQDRVPDEVRATVSLGLEVTCPFDEEHSNAGDPNDRACMISNMGELSPDYFTFKCQHEGCRQYTSLDMLGKCITNDWFTEDDLWSEDFNAVEGLEGKSASKENSYAALENRLDNLTSPTDKDINEIIADLIKVDGVVTRTRIRKKIAALVKISVTAVEDLEKKATKKSRDEKSKKRANTASKTHANYEYDLEFHIDDAKAWTRKVILSRNNNYAAPVITVSGNVVKLLHDTALGEVLRPLTLNEFVEEQHDLMTFQRKTDAGLMTRKDVPPAICQDNYLGAYKYLPTSPTVCRIPSLIVTGKDEYRVLNKDKTWFDPSGVNIYLTQAPLVIEDAPDIPSDLEIAAAKETIEEILADFCFSDIENEKRTTDISWANAVAMLITPFATPAIKGRLPLFAILKPHTGAGASLLAQLPTLISEGEVPSAIEYHENNEDENVKLIVAAIKDGRRAMWYDNVNGHFNSNKIQSTLTSSKMSGRELGVSMTVECHNDKLWIVCGINTSMGDEMARRACVMNLNLMTVDLQSKVYKHISLQGYVLDNRAQIVHAIVVLMKAWIARGAQYWSGKGLHGFQEWSKIVGGIMNVAWPDHRLLENPLKPSAISGDAQLREIAAYLFKHYGEKKQVTNDALNDAIALEADWVEGHDHGTKIRNSARKLNRMKSAPYKLGENQYTFDMPADNSTFKFNVITEKNSER